MPSQLVPEWLPITRLFPWCLAASEGLNRLIAHAQDRSVVAMQPSVHCMFGIECSKVTPLVMVLAGVQAMLHSLVHIEGVAVDLAWDAVARFGRAMPRAFSNDFVAVAEDEARHFTLLKVRCR